MRPSLYLLALGGVLIGPSAEASILDYITVDGHRAAWTSATCDEVAPDPTLKATCHPTVDTVPVKVRGPRGRVLLARDGLTFFEADADSGAVDAVVTDGEGGILSVTQLLGPLASNGNAQDRRLVTARIEKVLAETGLISTKLAGTKRVVTLTVVTFPPDGSDFEEVELSFDLDNLDPTVSPGALRSLSVGGGASLASTYTYWVPPMDDGA